MRVNRRHNEQRVWVRLSRTFFVLCLAVILTAPETLFAATLSHEYPKKANYYLAWHITDADVYQLAKWDVVVLDMENQAKNPEQLRKLRKLNPNIVLLAYITAQEIRKDASQVDSAMRRKLVSGIPDPWYLSRSGQRLSYWSGTYMLNVSDVSPKVNGVRYNQYLSDFVANEILGTGLWDGVFYDNVWDGVTWAFGKEMDLDGDNRADDNVNEHWNNGLRELINLTRSKTGNRFYVVGNGYTKQYRDELNGVMLENFPHEEWRHIMDKYNYNQNGTQSPRLNIINANSGNTGRQDDYRAMRFGLTSALLGNGYFSFDYGDQRHEQTWWYDEYNVKLGEPLGAAVSQSGRSAFLEDVWRRDFKNGVVLVNATNQVQRIDLGGEYEKIIGTQDTIVNDGSIVDSVRIAPKDGVILFKIAKTVANTLFTNGSFMRFFSMSGDRARNGFFAFEDAFAGGVKIYNGDINGDGQPEKIVVNGRKLQIFNNRGEEWYSDYPFGANSVGDLSISVGQLDPAREPVILVASAKSPKLIMYNYHGQLLKDDIYPLGKKYAGGFTVTVANVNAAAGGEAVIMTSKGQAAEVVVLDTALKKIQKRFYPFDKNYKLETALTSGDFDGDGVDEIAVAGTVNKKPVIRIFDVTGKKKSEFRVGGFFGNTSVTLGASDVNFEGKKEIVVMTKN